MSVKVDVLISGITDPKWPLQERDLEGPGAIGPAISRILSPFDEAAIECALKLRDANKATQVRLTVACSAEDLGLMRTVASFRPDQLRGLVIPQEFFWDAQALSQLLGQAIGGGDAAADIVLIGREFGDCDDGAVPPCLAEALGYPFAGLVQEVRIGVDGKFLVRERGNVRESLRFRNQPVVASVTNAKSNRLRYPLMKNVMAAKRERMDMTPSSTEGLPRHRVASSVILRRPKLRSASACVLLSGPDAQQAAQFMASVRRLLSSHG